MTVEIGIQQPFDAAVVIVTLLRPSLPQAVRSVYAQQGAGRVQVVLAVDGRADTSGMLPMLRAECPSHMHLTVIDTGYSLSVRNGSLYPTRSGGSLRTAASSAGVGATANSAGQLFTFTATVANNAALGSPTRFEWDFGDGSTATTNGPSIGHVYSMELTTYNITVRAVFANGSAVSALTQIITADFP